MTARARTMLFLSFVLVVCVDQGAKFCARRLFAAAPVRTVGPLTIAAPTENELVFPSPLRSRKIRYALYALAAIGLCLIANAARGSTRATTTSAIALGLLTGGTAASVIDRARHGGVTDFLHVSLGPLRCPLNPAELAFVAAILLLALAPRKVTA